jgi:hypothetical protein
MESVFRSHADDAGGEAGRADKTQVYPNVLPETAIKNNLPKRAVA